MASHRRPEDEEQATQQAMQMTQQALIQFHNELNQGQLGLRERNPEFVLEKISDGLDAVSAALLADPTFTPAWLLKARYHMACLEIAQAKDAFATAQKTAVDRQAEGKPDFLGPDNPADLVALSDLAMKTSGDRFKNTARLLENSGSPIDQVAAGVIRFFDGKPISKRTSFGLSPMERPARQSEIAVDLIAANGGSGRVKITGGGKEIQFSGIENLSNLALMKKFSPAPSRVRIEGASTLDWTNLAALPLESLDLTGCQLSAIPAMTPSFQRLQNLVLKDTGFSELSCVRRMPQLASLDISGTQISDLAPLATCRWLQSLDAGSLSLENVRTLAFPPIARLTISPMMIADKAALNGLRASRRLIVLRAPGDPADQPAAEFWKKLDAGGYDTSY